MIEVPQPIPLVVYVRDANRARWDYGFVVGLRPAPIEPPPTPSGLLYGDWDATGAVVQGLYGSWHAEGAAVDVVELSWS